MNQKSQLARFLVALTGALVVVAATWVIRHPDDATRTIANQREARAIRVDDVKKSRLERHASVDEVGKATGSFTVTITGERDSASATRVRLKGVISAEQHLAAQEFSWILPARYAVVDGITTGMIPDLQPGQRHQVFLLVDRAAQPAQPIVLHVFKLVNSEPRGQIAQYDFSDLDGSSVRASSEATKNPSAATPDYVQ